MKAVIILSGGMDSTTLAYDIVHKGGYEEVHAISFNYGQKHTRELECACKSAAKLGITHYIVNLSPIKDLLKSALTGDYEVPEGAYDDESQKLTVVPNRNMIMLSIAAGYAMSIGAEDLFYGAHANDFAIYPDCRPEFVEKMNAVLKVAHYTPVRLHVPYQYYGKANIAARGHQLGVPFEDTWTCYNGGEKSCGKCGSCSERLMAFREANLKDPLEYES